ncbi:tyrosine-type recombinase/integrase [Streptomyces maoxianensis]|uniref:Tyrosine-type recombinase/integrase n=1 Tax=Streptomyces maoxianensis TaxID=1459942 RepID=A0ABV9G6M7_9ACTN
MAEVYDRWHLSRPKKDAKPCPDHSSRTRVLVPSVDHGQGKRWQVRYRDTSGQQRKENFEKKTAADARAAEVETELNRGDYIDRKAGKVTLREYAKDWLASRTSNPSSVDVERRHLELHILPVLGARELAALRPSTVRAWLGGLQKTVQSDNYVVAIHGTLSSVLNAAVDDEKIRKNPCHANSVRPPKKVRKKIQPWPLERVAAVIDGLDGRYASMVILGAGAGLRQGEIFGLAVEDVDFLRGVVRVDRQIKLFGCKPVFSLPKGDKTREVPLSPKLAAALAAHLKAYPPHEVTLPWRTLDGKPVTHRLFFTTAARHRPHIRSVFNTDVWKPALSAAGVIPPPVREKGKKPKYAAAEDDGMHALRHHYASVLLDAGENINALSEYLGHHDPGFTLRTYCHLMPASEERTKKAVDGALGAMIDGLLSQPSARRVPLRAM